MPTLTAAPKFTTFAPVIYHSAGEIYVSMSIGNFGDAPAAKVFVTGLSLGSAVRSSPAILPVYLGTIAIRSRGQVNAHFRGSSLTVGQNYLLTVRGTYMLEGAAYGFTVNRPVVIPPPREQPIALLKARVEAVLSNATWSYSIFNEESSTSPLHLAAFSIDLANPLTFSAAPPGWGIISDNSTGILWRSLDRSAPYGTHVAPGTSLSGFQIQSATSRSESTPYSITSWDHADDKAGLVTFDYVVSPGRAA